MKRIEILISFLLMTIMFMGCKDDETVNVKPVAAFKTSVTQLEEGQSLTFTDLSYDEDGEIVKWEWDFGNGQKSTDRNPIVTFNTIGEFNVVLSVYDNQGAMNANDFSKVITVKEKTQALESPQILWEYTAPAGFQVAAPAIDFEHNVIFGCDAKDSRGIYNVIVLNSDGKEKWKGIIGDVVRTTPTISDDGIFYLGSNDKYLYAFNTESNNYITRASVGTTVKYTAPVVDIDGTVYIAVNKKLYAFSASPDMKKLWEFDCQDVTQSSPIIGMDAIYVCSNSGNVYAVNKVNGSKIWETPFGKSCSAFQAMGKDGTLYICGNTETGGVVMALNSLDGSIKWQNSTVATFDQCGIVLDSDGRLFVGDNDGVLNCYQQNDGSLVWTFKSQSKIHSTPVVTDDGKICFGDGAGYFYVLNQEGKSAYKELKLGVDIWSNPLIGPDGLIYVCANVAEGNNAHEKPGKVYALKITATGASNSWAMAGCNHLRNGRLE